MPGHFSNLFHRSHAFPPVPACAACPRCLKHFLQASEMCQTEGDIPWGSRKVRGVSPKRLRGTYPRAAFLVDNSGGCSSKPVLLHPRMTWSHFISARAAASALLNLDGKGSCAVLHPPAAPQKHISFCRWKNEHFALFLFLKSKDLSANTLDLIPWLNFEFT